MSLSTLKIVAYIFWLTGGFIIYIINASLVGVNILYWHWGLQTFFVLVLYVWTNIIYLSYKEARKRGNQ